MPYLPVGHLILREALREPFIASGELTAYYFLTWKRSRVSRWRVEVIYQKQITSHFSANLKALTAAEQLRFIKYY